MASAYTSASLEYGTSTNIRVVELLQNSSREPITCKLHVMVLDDQIGYSALSYVWGDETNKKKIVLDGKPFYVRENLWNLLQQARQSLFTGILWIDAISIDQANVPERNHQVAMMGAIYAEAELVVVWLGLETGATARAIRELSDIRHSNREPANWLYFSQSIRSICEAEYWTRLWIVQEFVLARKVIVWCGMERLRDDCLYWLYHIQLDRSLMPSSSSSNAYRDITKLTVDSPAVVMMACKLARSKAPRMMSFTALFQMSERLKCLDVRDRVYALLSLVSPEERAQLAIVPDYSKPASEFFEDLYAALRRCSTSHSAFQGRSLRYWLVKFQNMLALEDIHEVVRRVMAEYDRGTRKVDIKEVIDKMWDEPWTPIAYVELRADDELIAEIPEALLQIQWPIFNARTMKPPVRCDSVMDDGTWAYTYD
ncbi:Nn.00g031760.m01.CDS01 [Neocucurbitaria sp. VM-36]